MDEHTAIAKDQCKGHEWENVSNVGTIVSHYRVDVPVRCTLCGTTGKKAYKHNLTVPSE